MFRNVSHNPTDMDFNEQDIVEEIEQKPRAIDVCIPKIEPVCPVINEENLKEATPNVDGTVISDLIHFITPHKIRDPIILVERCDKIWETLKMIKDVQNTKHVDIDDALSSETATTKASYIEYMPVLGNGNTRLPNFKFSVKATKKLYHCTICGKQYAENRGLRCHSERIHGIFIPLKRNVNRKNTDKATEKEPFVPASEKAHVDNKEDDVEKVPLRKTENEVHTEALTLDRNKILPDVQKKVSQNDSQKRKNNAIHNNNSTQTTEHEQDIEVLNRASRQNNMSNPLEKCVAPLMCTLCKQTVEDMKIHLIDYHKIESPDFMLKSLNETSIASAVKKLETIYYSDKTLKENKISKEESPLDCSNKKKRRASIPCENPRKRQRKTDSGSHTPLGSDTHKCNICLGLYKASSIHKHVRNHHLRGETKENFHLSKCRCRKSPLYALSKEHPGSDNAFSEGKVTSNEEKNEELLEAKRNDKGNTNCSCGRSFRNPHTLFIHQKTCTVTSKTKQISERFQPPLTIVTSEKPEENNVSKPRRYVTRNSLDRDSGIGISITIKKKNNSYEIIDKDNQNEKKVQDWKASEDTNMSLSIPENSIPAEFQDHPHQNLSKYTKRHTLPKYSKEHSILKIQSVDEDIDIDIEEDSQSNFSNDNRSDSTYKVNNSCSEELQLKIKVEQDDKYSKENFKSDPEKAEEPVKTNHDKSTTYFAKKYNICVCGHKCYTKKALEIHVSKHHPSSKLICGYCKISFPDINEWNIHQCSVNVGKKFINLPMEVNCPYCKTILNTYKRFDEHVKHKHYDRVVPYQCFHCHKRFPNPTTRKVHFNTEHTMIVCSICNNNYYVDMDSRHKAYHFGLGYPCHSCKKTYTSKESFLRHSRRVHLASAVSFETPLMDSPNYNL